jgi:hypothetical protein
MTDNVQYLREKRFNYVRVKYINIDIKMYHNNKTVDDQFGVDMSHSRPLVQV